MGDNGHWGEEIKNGQIQQGTRLHNLISPAKCRNHSQNEIFLAVNEPPAIISDNTVAIKNRMINK